MHPVVQVAAGLYYLFGGLYVLKKLVGPADYFDLVIPSTTDRPTMDSQSDTYGLLGFSTGLYKQVAIPDSGILVSNNKAWNVKLPWEVHLRRKLPDAAVYDENYPPWIEAAEAIQQRFLEMGFDVPEIKEIIRGLIPPKTVEFEVRGKYLDLNWTDEEVRNFAYHFRADQDFTEITLGDMMRQNDPGATGVIRINDGNVAIEDYTLKATEERPIFFHEIFNPKFGVTSDWLLSFSDVYVTGVHGTEDKDLRRWFDWELPKQVRLKLTAQPTPEYQELNLEW